MSRFSIFFSISFLVHIALGAVLLYKIGILDREKKQGIEEIDTTDLEPDKNQARENQTGENKITKKSKSKPKKQKFPTKPFQKPKEIKKLKTKTPSQLKNQEPLQEKEPVPEINKIKDTALKTQKPTETKTLDNNNTAKENSLKTTKQPSQKNQESLQKESKVKSPPDTSLSPVATSIPDEKSPAPNNNKTKDLKKESEDSSPDEEKPNNDSSLKQKFPSAKKYTFLKQKEGNPKPNYPQSALENKWEGRVEVLYYVNPAGFVEKIQVLKSSGHPVLDNSAVRALSQYHYHPGQEGWIKHPVEFFLDQESEIQKTAPLATKEDK